MYEEKNKANIKSPDEIVISETETVVEPAKTKPAAEPKPKKRVGLGILVTILVLLLIGGALAIGYLWGNNTIKPIDDNAQSSNSKTNNETATEPEPKEEQAEEKEAIAEDVSNLESQQQASDENKYLYLNGLEVKLKIKIPNIISFAYATDNLYNVYVWGHKYNPGEQAVPAQGTIIANYNEDTIRNPVYLGRISFEHCDYATADCSGAVLKFKDDSIALVYRESTSAAEKYASETWTHGGESAADYAASVTADIKMLKEHFTNPNNYIEIK
ncbi:MAG: hypothetical protein Q4A25_00615 [Candidatus Saccharibacteria bacterium]|nr:hypothetical protein [Candidatus Saccharibacteria bacterium]